MNPENQRITIAEFCGWALDSDGLWNNGSIKAHGRTEVPNYPNDLNAMYEAEKCLSETERLIFIGWLCAPHFKLVSPVFANASERAEAFLRTIGKWE